MGLSVRLWRSRQAAPIQEQGMALPVALIIGALLLVASAGLLVKLMMLRSAGSAESYKQLAELASGNGLQRPNGQIGPCLAATTGICGQCLP